jgi:hypothetical protein
MKRPDGVTAIAVWFFVDAILLLLFTCILIAIPTSGAIGEINDPVGEFFVVFFLTCSVIFILLFGILSVFAGWGLLRIKEWARWLSIVIGFFSLFAFPAGTIIGALIIWYLLKADVREVFDMAESGVIPAESTSIDAQLSE